MMRIRLAFLMLLLSALMQAQKEEKAPKTPKTPAPKAEYFKGYVVNEKGDTIRGEVKYNPKKEQDCFSKVIFRDETGAQKNYKPKKAKAYGFNGQHYVAMEFEGEPKYYRVLVSGDINMYEMMYEMISMNQPVVGSVYYVSHKDDKHLKEIKESKFKKQMTDYMKDHPEVLDGYEDGKEFNAESAIAVIRQYNAWKATQ